MNDDTSGADTSKDARGPAGGPDKAEPAARKGTKRQSRPEPYDLRTLQEGNTRGETSQGETQPEATPGGGEAAEGEGDA